MFDFPEVGNFKYIKVIAKNQQMIPERFYLRTISIFFVTVITRDYHMNIRNIKEKG